jgi:hypothetical protein
MIFSREIKIPIIVCSTYYIDIQIILCCCTRFSKLLETHCLFSTNTNVPFKIGDFLQLSLFPPRIHVINLVRVAAAEAVLLLRSATAPFFLYISRMDISLYGISNEKDVSQSALVLMLARVRIFRSS